MFGDIKTNACMRAMEGCENNPKLTANHRFFAGEQIAASTETIPRLHFMVRSTDVRGP
jgi:hypothetical protein